MKRELRISDLELRSEGSRQISGYAAKFNSWSQDLGGFREKINPGAFKRSISSGDVVALFNHNPAALLGRTTSGTLDLREDEVGLYFQVNLPATELGREVHELVRRRDLNGCSFSFSTREDKWSKDGNERTLMDVDLFDVGPVTFPAYQSTSVSARSEAKGYGSVGLYRFDKPRSSGIYRPVELSDETARARAQFEIVRLECER